MTARNWRNAVETDTYNDSAHNATLNCHNTRKSSSDKTKHQSSTLRCNSIEGQKLFRPRVPTGIGLFTKGSVSSPLRSAWRSSYSREASLMSSIWAFWKSVRTSGTVDGGGAAYFGQGRTSSGDEEAIAALATGGQRSRRNT